MIRGKKNFLPPCHLILGLSLLYKLEDSFKEKHRGERRIRTFDDEGIVALTVEKLKEMTIENEQLEPVAEDVEIELKASDSDEPKQTEEQDEKKSNKGSSDNEDEKEVTFPDTEVKIEQDTGKVIVRHDSRVEPTTTATEIKTVAKENEDEDEKPYIIPAVAPRKKQQQNGKKRKEEKQNQQKQQQINNQKEDGQSNQMKRGQRGKLKKIKSKYRDQDEEERQLRMNILKSASTEKQRSMRITEDNSKLNKMKRQFEPKQVRHPDSGGAGDEDENDDVTVSADVDMLDSLTGNPFEDDELLFAIPVVAPYQALHNYKYKVKLTPGPGKRGGASKTAILMFSKDKACTAREKDLLKVIKEEQLARNMPGKVKLSAPQLQKFKK